jgi:hypothetical protein
VNFQSIGTPPHSNNNIACIAMPSISLGNPHASQLFTTKRQKGWAVSVVGMMQISVGILALRVLAASVSQLECDLVA